jgi:hypothetical protein
MMFMFRSTCFGRLHGHHQELTTALTASGFTLEIDGGSIVGRGLAGQTTTNNSVTLLICLYGVDRDNAILLSI